MVAPALLFVGIGLSLFLLVKLLLSRSLAAARAAGAPPSISFLARQRVMRHASAYLLLHGTQLSAALALLLTLLLAPALGDSAASGGGGGVGGKGLLDAGVRGGLLVAAGSAPARVLHGVPGGDFAGSRDGNEVIGEWLSGAGGGWSGGDGSTGWIPNRDAGGRIPNRDVDGGGEARSSAVVSALWALLAVLVTARPAISAGGWLVINDVIYLVSKLSGTIPPGGRGAGGVMPPHAVDPQGGEGEAAAWLRVGVGGRRGDDWARIWFTEG